MNSPVAQKLFVTLGACDEGWFVEMNSIWMELVRKRWPGSVEPLGILHNAPSKREGFCCRPNHTFHLYEQITQEKLNLALEQGRVKAALPLRAIQESQNKLAKQYRDDGVCRNKTTPWWTGLDCGGFLMVFITLSSWRSTHYVLAWRRASLQDGQQDYKSKLFAFISGRLFCKLAS